MLVGVQQLRFIAAGLVVISHAVMTATFTLGYVLPGWVSWLDGVGVVGVEVFFVISGFIMARSVRFESADELRGLLPSKDVFLPAPPSCLAYLRIDDCFCNIVDQVIFRVFPLFDHVPVTASNG